MDVIRKYSTPIIIGAGIFVAITGLLMFFETEGPFKTAHEYIGLVFCLAIGLHIFNHWHSFKKYFSRKITVSIILIAWIAGSLLLLNSFFSVEEDAEELIFERLEQTPISLVAPLVGMDLTNLRAQLSNEQVTIPDSKLSIEQLADQNGIETQELLILIFR